MKHEPLQAIVFDFDGTLAGLTIDFDAMKREALELGRRHAAALGLETETAGVDAMRPVLEWMEEHAAALEAVSGRAAGRAFLDECMALVEAVEIEAAARGYLFPETRGLLRGLRDSGPNVGVITRNCAKAVRAVFPDVDAHCGCVLAREAAPRVKPHPSHLLLALELLRNGDGTPRPERSLMVGDHPLDIETGRAAGTLTAAVATGRISLAELKAYGPDFIAPDCFALMRELRCLGLAPA